MTIEQKIRDKWEQWREENAGTYKANDIANFFISHRSSELQELIEKLETMKVEKASVLNSELRTSKDKNSTLHSDFSTKLAYNEAISHVISILQAKLK